MYGTTFPPNPGGGHQNDQYGEQRQGGYADRQGGNGNEQTQRPAYDSNQNQRPAYDNNASQAQRPPYDSNKQQTQRPAYDSNQNQRQSYGNGGGGGYQGNREGNWNNNRSQGGGGGGGKPPWNNNRQPFKRPEETDMTLYKPYAATGNKEAPPDIIRKFEELAKLLDHQGYTTRVGGMEGIEEAVERTQVKQELILPFKEFNQKQSKFTWSSERAFSIAKMFHPTFDSMKKGVQYFLAKNARLILGDKMNSPSLFLICWTEDGAESVREKSSRTGFSGHPIAIASAIGIPIFNLGKPDAEQRLKLYLESTHGETA